MALNGNPNCFLVAYRYRKPTTGWCRIERHGNITMWGLPPARSETGVLAYLRKLHPGTEILIERLTWDNER